MYNVRIRSGGQSGVDRAALDVAVAHDLAYTGWCPRGGLAEDEPNPPGLLRRYPRLRETPSDDSRQRTAWNVRDADATLILLPRGMNERSPGTEFTVTCAQLLFECPLLEIHLPLDAPAGADEVECARTWIGEAELDHAPPSRRFQSAEGGELELNVAGPRQSQAPGIYTAAYAFLERLLGAVD